MTRPVMLRHPLRRTLLVLAVLAASAVPAAAQGYDRDYGSYDNAGPADRYGDGGRPPYRDERYDERDAGDDRYDRSDARGGGESSFAELDRWGDWIDHPAWGTVWRPRVSVGWRPYTVGRWINTEDYGWYWESDEPFGWAVFHYGRWVWDEGGGWLWLPGTEWAPAWVAWSHNDEWVGWAPLPPDAVWDDDRGLVLHARFYEPRFAPWWVFVSPRYMLAPGVHRHLAPWRGNAGLLRIVRPATHYRFSGRRVYNSGIAVRHVERLTRTRIASVRIVHTNRPFIRSGRSDTVRVFQPRIAPAPAWQNRRGTDWRRFDGRRHERANLVPPQFNPGPRSLTPQARPNEGRSWDRGMDSQRRARVLVPDRIPGNIEGPARRSFTAPDVQRRHWPRPQEGTPQAQPRRQLPAAVQPQPSANPPVQARVQARAQAPAHVQQPRERAASAQPPANPDRRHRGRKGPGPDGDGERRGR